MAKQHSSSSQQAAKHLQMLFVHNMDTMQKLGKHGHGVIYEYEVSADADVRGELKFGPYHLMMWDIEPRHQGESRRLILRMEEAPDDILASGKAMENSQIYHGGGPASEIVAMATLALRRRLSLRSVVRMDDRPVIFGSRLHSQIDPEILRGTTDLASVGEWLDLAANLKPELQQRFVLAVKLYQQALELIEDKPDLAYLNLVSSIEVISGDFPINKTVRDADPTLVDLLAEISDPELAGKIEQRLLSRHFRFIQQRFTQFVVQHIDESFWWREDATKATDELRSWPGTSQITPEQLPQLLKQIYNQRSRTLHAGDPFPPTIFNPLFQGAGAEYIDRINSGGREWNEKQLIPYPQFFERLINHVLKTYLKRNQVEHPTPGIDINEEKSPL